jgi:tryptophanyl-tRNA synthetase
MTTSPNPRSRVLSGMRPTGKLHLGNYVGALQNWVKLQHMHDCFFFIADWHALTTDYDDTSRLADNSVEVMLDFLAAGLDPEKCVIFVQSHVKQHAELHLLFSMITPLGWLERVPSFKEQQQQMPDKDLHMYGFLGYPLLQAADILIYRAHFVPVGEDQSSHVELTREVARRFNNVYKVKGSPIFPEPDVLLTPSPKLLGTDKRKMSKSYGNSILLSEEPQQVAEKIRNSVTDRPKVTDRGSPDRCPVGNLHQIFSDAKTLAHITEGCTQATITCVECKELAIRGVNAHLEPIRERRRALTQQPEKLKQIIQQGDEKARCAAEETMVAVRESVGLLRVSDVTELAPREATDLPLRVPESISSAKTDEEKWEISFGPWLERVSKTHPLRQDRPRTFITIRGRKVGVQAAAEHDGMWKFRLNDRPLNVLVLLAQDKERYLHDFILPPKLVQDHWKQFEREDGNVVISVRRNAEGAVLVIGNRDIPIQHFKANYADLEQMVSATHNQASEFPFAVTVGQIYDGPLDLLLDLIRKQDIDIYDIPIAKITAQYLVYVENLKQLDVNVAAEFIYMASLLIHIKSKMLLPRDPDLPADQQDDPRDELVQRLLEHEKFKNAAQMLLQKQQLEEAVVSNPALKEFKDAEGTEPELVADVVDLVRTFQQILERAKSRPILQVDEETVTVAQMVQFFRRRLLMEDKPLRLKRMLQHIHTRNALISAFLALLELVRLQAILLRQDKVFGDILIKKHEMFDTVMGETAAVKDDWR